MKVPIYICQDTDSPHEKPMSGLMILEIICLCGKKPQILLQGTAKLTFVRKVGEISKLRILSDCKRGKRENPVYGKIIRQGLNSD